MLPMSLKFWTQHLNQLFLLASTCGLYVCLIRILCLVSFHYLALRNRMSYINLSKFMLSPMLKAQLYHLHISLSHLSSFESKPNILSFVSFSLFFFSLGFESNHKSLISPSDTHLGLSIDCS